MIRLLYLFAGEDLPFCPHRHHIRADSHRAAACHDGQDLSGHVQDTLASNLQLFQAEAFAGR
ncbi:hypothetical protein [Paenibacillus dendritiformis]|uniref:hypothetical protein n=1 Tax=Paenibacillus dendritiformis TaxID=130049 RepID=UPI00387E040E